MSEFSDRLKDIEARTNAATAGPWEHYAQSRVDYQGDITDSWVEVRGDIRREGTSFNAVARTPELEPWAKEDLVEAAKDAEFIAAARTDIPWLIEELRKARHVSSVALGKLTRVRKYVDFLDESYSEEDDVEAKYVVMDLRKALDGEVSS